jgi:hypothetical protein
MTPAGAVYLARPQSVDHMRPFRTLLVALAIAGVVAGCDSGGDGTDLTASFFVGSWELTAVRDNNGDRTAEVALALDDLTIDFTSGGQFAMMVDYTAPVNAGGTADTTFAGSYGVSGSGSLVLTPGTVSVPFTVTTQGTDRAELSTLAAIVNELLSGSDLDLGLVGTAVLTIDRF